MEIPVEKAEEIHQSADLDGDGTVSLGEVIASQNLKIKSIFLNRFEQLLFGHLLVQEKTRQIYKLSHRFMVE